MLLQETCALLPQWHFDGMLDRRRSVGPERSVDARDGAFMGRPETTRAPGDERFFLETSRYFNFIFLNRRGAPTKRRRRRTRRNANETAGQRHRPRGSRTSGPSRLQMLIRVPVARMSPYHKTAVRVAQNRISSIYFLHP